MATSKELIQRLRSQDAHDGKTFPAGGEPPNAVVRQLLREAADALESAGDVPPLPTADTAPVDDGSVMVRVDPVYVEAMRGEGLAGPFSRIQLDERNGVPTLLLTTDPPPTPDTVEWWRAVAQGLGAEIGKLKALAAAPSAIPADLVRISRPSPVGQSPTGDVPPLPTADTAPVDVAREAISLARHMANTWACVAKAKRDLDYIHASHRKIDALTERLAPSPETVECEGVTTRWCPNCGTCTCPADQGGDEWNADPACPIHGSRSTHDLAPSPETVSVSQSAAVYLLGRLRNAGQLSPYWVGEIDDTLAALSPPETAPKGGQ